MFYDRAFKTWVAGLLVLETPALFSKGDPETAEKPTFCFFIRRWFGIKPRRKRRLACASAFFGFCGWLWVHIVFDTWSYTPRRRVR
jgi:hypothetical protein